MRRYDSHAHARRDGRRCRGNRYTFADGHAYTRPGVYAYVTAHTYAHHRTDGHTYNRPDIYAHATAYAHTRIDCHADARSDIYTHPTAHAHR